MLAGMTAGVKGSAAGPHLKSAARKAIPAVRCGGPGNLGEPARVRLIRPRLPAMVNLWHLAPTETGD
jgi:hypothetical protein